MTLPQNASDLIKHYLLTLQKNICKTLENIDQKATFREDQWERPSGGGGLTCVMEQGQVFAKAGVNFSHVYGTSLPKAATLQRQKLEDTAFQALGLSLVIHPKNPYVPTTHFNVRFFSTVQQNERALPEFSSFDNYVDVKPSPTWWFGGGFDLTPYYGFEEDCIHWHQTAHQACQPFGEQLYPRLKTWCDEYFYLSHRQEARGIGGLFFDDFCEGGFVNSFNFMKSVGDHFLTAYEPIVIKRKDMAYGQREIDFQQYRHGRYVEFNLIHDRGTLFGLQSGGRTESILMSLPDIVQWRYNWQPEPGSEEEKLYKNFLPAQDWLKNMV